MAPAWWTAAPWPQRCGRGDTEPRRPGLDLSIPFAPGHRPYPLPCGHCLGPLGELSGAVADNKPAMTAWALVSCDGGRGREWAWGFRWCLAGGQGLGPPGKPLCIPCAPHPHILGGFPSSHNCRPHHTPGSSAPSPKALEPDGSVSPSLLGARGAEPAPPSPPSSPCSLATSLGLHTSSHTC